MKKVRIIIVLLITSAMMTLSSCNEKDQVVINTEFGAIHVALDLQNAPVTTANFLRYVDAGLFDSAYFYRVVRPDNQQKDSIRIAVIQGGRYRKDVNSGFPPIAHETTETTGIRHLNGTISMARRNPGTATSEFFICVGDQPELDYGAKRNPDGQGFAAFGQVTKGMDVVMKIHSIEAPAQYLDKPILIYSIKRK